jgi:SAM-dependent methyltransferase
MDLNPKVTTTRGAKGINYQVGDHYCAPFAAGSFEAITAISVIEHGFRGSDLLSEISRLLRPDGFFVASVDYWRDQLDTSGVRMFGMDWKIFSEREIKDFLDLAKDYGLVAFEDLGHFPPCERAPITWGNQTYTFAWFALRKLSSRCPPRGH